MVKILDIATARDAAEAHFWISVLAQEGIEAHVSNEALSIGIGELPPGPATNPGILVREEDAARARAVLAALAAAEVQAEDEEADEEDDDE